MKRNTQPKMALLEFIVEHFVPDYEARAGKPIGSMHRRMCLWLETRLADYLKTTPRLEHLTDATLQALLEFGTNAAKQKQRTPAAVHGRKPEPVWKPWTVEKARNYFRILWGRAAALGLIEGGESTEAFDRRKSRAIPLSEAEGTLWHYCLKRYFPTNLNIRHPDTKMQYAISLRQFGRFLGHAPALADLTDDTVLAWMSDMRERLSPKTVNERRGRILALWTWLAKKRIVYEFPFVGKLKEPRRTPRAWSISDLQRLFAACAQRRGWVAGIRAGEFWLALHLVLWDTGARIGEIMAARWDWLNLDTGFLDIQAEVRKGSEEDVVYKLHPDTLAMLRRIEEPKRDLIFVWPHAEGTLYNQYKEILQAAGLCTERQSKFHRMRKSVASHIQAAGHDASAVLHHSSSAVTEKFYIDPHIVGVSRPSEILVRITPPLLPKPMLRIEGPK